MVSGLRNACGVALIVVGILAVPAPIVPGLPIIAAGVALLGDNHPLVRKCRAWLQKQWFWKKEWN